MCRRYRNLVEFFIAHGVMVGKIEFNVAFYCTVLATAFVIARAVSGL